jgi:hypothetical protein
LMPRASDGTSPLSILLACRRRCRRRRPPWVGVDACAIRIALVPYIRRSCTGSSLALELSRGFGGSTWSVEIDYGNNLHSLPYLTRRCIDQWTISVQLLYVSFRDCKRGCRRLDGWW